MTQTPNALKAVCTRIEDAQLKHELGTVWKHPKSGGYYILGGYALREEDLTPLVVYMLHPLDPKNKDEDHLGVWWTRPMDEFFDGRFVEVNAIDEQPLNGEMI